MYTSMINQSVNPKRVYQSNMYLVEWYELFAGLTPNRSSAFLNHMGAQTTGAFRFGKIALHPFEPVRTCGMIHELTELSIGHQAKRVGVIQRQRFVLANGELEPFALSKLLGDHDLKRCCARGSMHG